MNVAEFHRMSILFKMHQAGTSHFYPVPASAELIPDVTRHSHITETTCISAGKHLAAQTGFTAFYRRVTRVIIMQLDNGSEADNSLEWCKML
jgi:hypothetical protein